MKKLLLILLLIAGTAWAETATYGPDITGGVTEGSDVGFSLITTTRIDATTGVFVNITSTTSINSAASSTNTLAIKSGANTAGLLYYLGIGNLGISNGAVKVLDINSSRLLVPQNIEIDGGVKTAFRNLSSATETLTSADYFVNCLANDNEVVITMPVIDTSYSQTIMVKYTDSGSTNKCKLDGNGAEQVEGFDVYSGLDTYKEGVIVKSDGLAWWITGGL